MTSDDKSRRDGEDAQLPPPLIGADPNTPIDTSEHAPLLEELENPARERFRDENALRIANHASSRILIVAGPGSGKTYLFFGRIKYWLKLHPEASVYVSTFVRKLVNDLRIEIEKKSGLPEEDQQRVTVTTLHTLARSLVEMAAYRHGGTASRPLNRRVKIIANEWPRIVWRDVLAFHPELSPSTYSRNSLDDQLHTETVDETPEWIELRETYARLSTFYNAVGFADLIYLAREAVEENPALNEHAVWIIDEFQDFNRAEEHLIRAITATAQGVLIAGDDDQTLYQSLKSSLPEIIISYQDGAEFLNAMLPYCSRCSYYICLAAAAFISEHRADDSIKKIYLPLLKNPEATKVQVVATATPSGAVDYIARFLEDHEGELAAHEAKMEAGEETDPFLLILSHPNTLDFYSLHRADEQLRRLLERWPPVDVRHSPDYWRVATYYRVANDKADNFALRKVLYYEGTSDEDAHALLEEALANGRRLADVLRDEHQHVLETCSTVRQIAESDAEPDEIVSQLAAIVTIGEPERLIDEFLADPLGTGGDQDRDEGEEAIETAGSLAAVELMTMFRSKGLSAQHVILIGADNINMVKATDPVFFVAMTRARKSLHIITALKAGGASETHAFVRDLPEHLCEYGAYTKGNRTLRPLAGLRKFEQQVWSWSSRRRS